MVGRCKNNFVVGAKKTASCQIEFSGGKRKRDETLNIKEGGISIIEDRETGGQPNKLSKHSFLPGNNKD
jgi:hypothetical protein